MSNDISSARERIRKVLDCSFTDRDELGWCIACEEILEEILEGIAMRKSELKSQQQEDE